MKTNYHSIKFINNVRSSGETTLIDERVNSIICRKNITLLSNRDHKTTSTLILSYTST